MPGFDPYFLQRPKIINPAVPNNIQAAMESHGMTPSNAAMNANAPDAFDRLRNLPGGSQTANDLERAAQQDANANLAAQPAYDPYRRVGNVRVIS